MFLFCYVSISPGRRGVSDQILKFCTELYTLVISAYAYYCRPCTGRVKCGTKLAVIAIQHLSNSFFVLFKT